MCGLFAGHGSGKRTQKFDLQTHSAPGRDLNQAPKTCGSSRRPAAATHRVSISTLDCDRAARVINRGVLAVSRLLGSRIFTGCRKIRLASRPLKDAIDVADHMPVLVKRFCPRPTILCDGSPSIGEPHSYANEQVAANVAEEQSHASSGNLSDRRIRPRGKRTPAQPRLHG
jgi:hypothetical protein